MKRLHWILIAVAMMSLSISCKKKTEETTEPPVPVATTPTETVVDEPVVPVTVETETAPSPIERLQTLKGAMGDVYFDFDKSDLRDDTRATLQRHAAVLDANADINVLVEGHCDERGTEEYNVALGERRAERVRSYLVSLGIDASRMRTVSYGEMQPKASGHDEESWAQNRRAHFILSINE